MRVSEGSEDVVTSPLLDVRPPPGPGLPGPHLPRWVFLFLGLAVGAIGAVIATSLGAPPREIQVPATVATTIGATTVAPLPLTTPPPASSAPTTVPVVVGPPVTPAGANEAGTVTTTTTTTTTTIATTTIPPATAATVPGAGAATSVAEVLEL